MGNPCASLHLNKSLLLYPTLTLGYEITLIYVHSRLLGAHWLPKCVTLNRSASHHPLTLYFQGGVHAAKGVYTVGSNRLVFVLTDE